MDTVLWIVAYLLAGVLPGVGVLKLAESKAALAIAVNAVLATLALFVSIFRCGSQSF